MGADLNAMLANLGAQTDILKQMYSARDASLDRVGDTKSLTTQDFGLNRDSVSFSKTTTTTYTFSSNESRKFGCCCPCEPKPEESTHPAGSLKTDENGVITTPGGYKIEATKQHEWNITGPDGKTTKVWGDPHVAEGDGGKWDFKRDSTFVLGDGTRINVGTKPWQDGKMTVTDNLEVISGNDRVNVTGIADGKGKTGEITHDGYAHANSFGNKDVFVMGKESDDWSFQGKEVVGSENGGESFKLGQDLEAGAVDGKPADENDPAKTDNLDSLRKLVDGLAKLMDGLKDLLSNDKQSKKPAVADEPFRRNCWTPRHERRHDEHEYARGMRDAFRSVSHMLGKMADLFDLQKSVKPTRHVAY